MALLRLDKCLCDLGLGTRSEIRDWIRGGRVVGGDIHTAELDGFMHELRARE